MVSPKLLLYVHCNSSVNSGKVIMFSFQKSLLTILNVLLAIHPIIAGPDFQFPSNDTSEVACLSNSTCLKYTECVLLMENSTARPQSAVFLSTIRDVKLICGWEGIEPKVCCPELETDIGELNEAQQIANGSGGKLDNEVSATTPEIAVETVIDELDETQEIVNGLHGKLNNGVAATTPAIAVETVINELNETQQIVHGSECGKLDHEVAATTSAIGVVEGAIVGGTDAMQGSWPWMAAIFQRDDPKKESPFCSGSLISANAVLTAAHCFLESDPLKEYVVILGSIVLGEGSDGLEVEVNNVTVHEKYEFPVVYHDIAILKLKMAVEFSANIRKICLAGPRFRKLCLDGRFAIITGWGHVKFGGTPSKTLQQGELPIVSTCECNEAYEDLLGSNESLPNGVTEEIICAGGEIDNKDACQGDSGGPLVYRHKESGSWVLIGIISYGFECGREIPGIYTRISHYTDWIERNV